MTGRDESSTGLYFIALIPGKELRDRVRAVKERMKAVYNAGHALKSPAHITLQMPFRWNSREEPVIIAALEKLALGERSFKTGLNGFGCFPQRVIFIKIENHEAIRSLHGRLKKVLKGDLGFPGTEIMNDVQPHITVATRDLTKDAFREAWPAIQHEEFRGSFEVNSLFLLKHNGKSWDIYKEFPFRADG
ncbi:MAG: 2'-5' RNA ligase family protein [Bacteroidales bacterium]|nr:2'-5' RNA ligase family protein [Bacteroidales bacterium]